MSEATEEAKPQVQIPKELLEDPAIYANVVLGILMPDLNVKLIFAEGVGTGTIAPRGCYVITPERAFYLAQTLLQCVEGADRVKKSIADAKKKMN